MFSLISFNTLKSLWSNRNVRYLILIILSSLVIIFGFNRITNSYYEKGIAHQIGVYATEQKKLKEEYENKLKVADDKRLVLNDELIQLKKEYSDLQRAREQKKLNQSEEVTKYGKTNDGSKRGIDAEWVRIYKGSLPD